MVLTGSVCETEQSTPLIRKIKIRQKLRRLLVESSHRGHHHQDPPPPAPPPDTRPRGSRYTLGGDRPSRSLLPGGGGGCATASAAATTTTASSATRRKTSVAAAAGATAAAAAAAASPPRAKDALTAAQGAAASSASRSPVLSGRRRGPLLRLERGGSQSPPPPTISKSASVPANLRAASKNYKEPSSSSSRVGSILRRSGSLLLTSLEPRGLSSLLGRRNQQRHAQHHHQQQQRRSHHRHRTGSQHRSSRESSPTGSCCSSSSSLGPGAASGSGSRKCVSFSAETIGLDEGRRPGSPDRPRKTAAVHEAKVYRKGVLQDRNGVAEKSPNLPLSWEESLGGPRALLGAAQDGDDELVKRIVTLANKSGFGNIDVNAVDASGRTAVSYMAGNGSALMLEACVAFHGADANLPDNEGNTPLHFAAQAGQTECLNILLQRCSSIEVDARNSLGFTPLMKAALQGRTKCAKILLFAGANPTLRDHGRGLRAEQWARFCCRYVCADVIERFARHRLLDKTTSCRWGSEPELASQVFQGKLIPVPTTPVQHHQPSTGFRSKIRRVFRTCSHTEKNSFSLVSQLTSAALCASSPVLPKPGGDVSPAVKNLLRPLSVPQLRITLVAPHQDIADKAIGETSISGNNSATFDELFESSIVKPPRTKKKSK